MSSNKDKVFIYWDNSNIYISAQSVAEEREGLGAKSRVRVDFKSLLRLAHADREIARAVAVGSIPPPLSHVWNSMENKGVEVKLQERGALGGGEQGVDSALQSEMLRDALDNNGNPGVVVLLTGDGSGFRQHTGFHADIERMYKRNWQIEVLSWNHSCNRHMQDWARENGVFVSLDDFYDSITFLERPLPGEPAAPSRHQLPLDLTKRVQVS